jgi:hypothetical protein
VYATANCELADAEHSSKCSLFLLNFLILLRIIANCVQTKIYARLFECQFLCETFSLVIGTDAVLDVLYCKLPLH